MTEYWKSVGNYYCNYCKCFVRNDEFNRRQHDASPRHQNSLKRQVRDIHRTSEREAREALFANRELAKIGGKINPSLKNPAHADADATGPKKVMIGTRQKQKRREKVETLDDGSVYAQALASQAIPGQWTTMETTAPAQSFRAESGTGSQAVKLELEKQEVDGPGDADGETDDASHFEPVSRPLARRRLDAPDEELLEYRVQRKQMVVPEDVKVEGEDITPVVFKKRKTKSKD